MIRCEYVCPVIGVDKPGIVAKDPTVEKDVQSADTSQKSVSIPDIDIPYLRYPSVVIIINRNVFYLNNSSIIIILYIRIIIKSRVNTDAHISKSNVGSYIDQFIDIKIKLTIGIDRKGNSVFHKDERFSISSIEY